MDGERRAEAGSSSASRTLRDVLEEGGDDALVDGKMAEIDEEVDGEEDEEVGAYVFVPGLLIPLKEQLEKDKVSILASSFSSLCLSLAIVSFILDFFPFSLKIWDVGFLQKM